jgi:hypothetical protein
LQQSTTIATQGGHHDEFCDRNHERYDGNQLEPGVASPNHTGRISVYLSKRNYSMSAIVRTASNAPTVPSTITFTTTRTTAAAAAVIDKVRQMYVVVSMDRLEMTHFDCIHKIWWVILM